MAEEKEPENPNKLPAELRIWADKGAPEDTRTVIFRVAPNVDLALLCKVLTSLNVQVSSTGPDVIVGTIAKRDLSRASKLQDVVRIERSMSLSSKDDDPKDDLLSYDRGKSLRLPES